MTQASRPQAEHSFNFPTGDSGPYSADQWREAWQVLFTGDQQTTQGPIWDYLNELITTLPGAGAGTTFTVGSGAGLVAGTLLVNSAAVSFTVSVPGATRYDLVVICENNTAATYNTNLEFPTTLTDYNGVASIPPYSARLAVLTGNPGVAATRALVQTANYYMVPLYEFRTLVGAGGISATGRVDHRIFAGSKLMEFFHQATAGWNYTDSTPISPAGTAVTEFKYGIELIANKVSEGVCKFNMPSNWDGVSDIELIGIFMATGVGTCNLLTSHGFGDWAGGMAYGSIPYATAAADHVTVANESFDHYGNLGAPGFILPNYICTAVGQRDGLAGTDTYAGDIYYRGCILRCRVIK